MSAYCDHILAVIIPLCRDRFADDRLGGFHEHLDAAGYPLPGPKRLMVQSRQLYVLSQAALLGDTSGQDIAERGYDFLRSHYHDKKHSGWFFRTSASGEPSDPSKDLYGHAFVLFALAHLHRAFAVPDAMALAGATMDTIHARMAAPGGGFWDRASEDWVPNTALRRQNPHMHLLEAMLALFEASGQRRWLDEAALLVTLFRERLFDPATGTLGEFFDAGWKPHPETGHIVEPGHHFEWVWLLHRYAALSGRPLEPGADALFNSAMRHGFDPDNGHIHDQLDRSGTPIQRTRRIWPVTEAIKAQVARVEAGLPEAADQLERLSQHLLDRFLRPAQLGWIETMAPDGTPTQTNLPGSTSYHLVMAAAEIKRVLP
jgi:mannose/cellobiose epimerase-like protein (N-acyl-D-glucosamine 2-epimerase family)